MDVYSWENHLFLWAIYTMANQRVSDSPCWAAGPRGVFMDAGFHLTGSAELLPPAVLHALVCAHARAGRGCTPWPSDLGSVYCNLEQFVGFGAFKFKAKLKIAWFYSSHKERTSYRRNPGTVFDGSVDLFVSSRTTIHQYPSMGYFLSDADLPLKATVAVNTLISIRSKLIHGVPPPSEAQRERERECCDLIMPIQLKLSLSSWS